MIVYVITMAESRPTSLFEAVMAPIQLLGNQPPLFSSGWAAQADRRDEFLSISHLEWNSALENVNFVKDVNFVTDVNFAKNVIFNL